MFEMPTGSYRYALTIYDYTIALELPIHAWLWLGLGGLVWFVVDYFADKRTSRIVLVTWGVGLYVFSPEVGSPILIPVVILFTAWIASLSIRYSASVPYGLLAIVAAVLGMVAAGKPDQGLLHGVLVSLFGIGLVATLLGVAGALYRYATREGESVTKQKTEQERADEIAALEHEVEAAELRKTIADLKGEGASD